MSSPTHALVSEFFLPSGWNRSKLDQVLSPHPVALVLNCVVDFTLPVVLIWSLSSHGKFTLSSAWQSLRLRRLSSRVLQAVWDSSIPLKISFFIWRALHQFLRTDDSLQAKGIPLVILV